MQTGCPREWLRPVEPSDQANRRLLGCHRGRHTALNVRNPKRGYHYYYCSTDESAVQRFLNDGWEVPQAGDPEKWGAKLPAHVQQQLDGRRAFQDVMLIRIPIPLYRERQREAQELTHAMREGVENDFFDKGREREAELGSAAPEDGPLYHKGRRHRTHVRERGVK
jgi:hypothetical protein